MCNPEQHKMHVARAIQAFHDQHGSNEKYWTAEEVAWELKLISRINCECGVVLPE
jgi:hypothetical protein